MVFLFDKFEKWKYFDNILAVKNILRYYVASAID